jgi:hypothetical protein
MMKFLASKVLVRGGQCRSVRFAFVKAQCKEKVAADITECAWGADVLHCAGFSFASALLIR